MKINEEEFKKSAELFKGVKLTESEKASMLSNIYQSELAVEASAVASPFIFSSIFVRERVMVAMASLVLVVMSGGYAAASSLPGDPLYGIKVNVLEPIVLQLTFDETEKNEYKMELLQRRVAELQTLRLNTEIDPESEEESYRAAQRNIAELEASAVYDSNGTNVDISSSVETYNSLIGETFRLETKVMKSISTPPVDEEVREADEEGREDEEDPILQKDTDEIKDVVEDTRKSLDEIDKEVEGVVDGVVEKEPLTEKIEPQNIKEKITPITEGLGF